MELLSIEEVKETELKLLVEFADFCEKNGLTYFLGYGTLLGAVRHKGFIPWDDDIDIMMPRPDYDRFIELTGFSPISESAETRLYEKCRNPNFYPFAKVVDSNTIVFEKGKTKKQLSAIWIDIFPLDGCPKNDIENASIFKRYKRLRNNHDLLTTNPFYNKQSLLKKIVKFIVRQFLKFIGVKRFCRNMDLLSRTHDYKESKYVTNLLWGDSPDERIERTIFEESTELPFEGHRFKVPKKYDEYLKRLYGNYMELPPESERIPHGFKAYRLK